MPLNTVGELAKRADPIRSVLIRDLQYTYNITLPWYWEISRVRYSVLRECCRHECNTAWL